MIRLGNWQAFLPACIRFAIGYIPLLAIDLWGRTVGPSDQIAGAELAWGIDGHNASDCLREGFTHLKHDRLSNFREASLKNTLYSLAAVSVILTLRNEAEFKAGSVPTEVYDLSFPNYWKWKGRLVPATLTWS